MVILLVVKDFSRFSALAEWFRHRPEIDVVQVASGAAGLAYLKDKPMDLVIVDEQLDDMNGIEFVNQLVKVNPMVYTAIVGCLSDEDFHEATEGLGVLMQLPSLPTEKNAEALLAVIEKIGGLAQPSALKEGKI